jgi:hypothetical protein
MDFCSTPIFNIKKVDKSTNFTADWIISHVIQHNSLCRDKMKYYVTDHLSYGLYIMSHVTLSCMHKLSPASTLDAQNKQRLRSKQPSHAHIYIYIYIYIHIYKTTPYNYIITTFKTISWLN